MNILVVDDTRMMRIIIRDILVKNCGINNRAVFEADSGPNAIKELHRCNANIVFLDINMPDMSGIEVIKKLIEFNPSIYIIMCTASKDRVDVVKCIQAGAKDYVTKPPTAERLLSALLKANPDFSKASHEENEELEESPSPPK